MSRSVKKKPVSLIKTPSAKKYAVRAFRRYKKELGRGKCAYKKLFPNWDIKDYIYYNPEMLVHRKLFRENAIVIRKILRGEIDPDNYNLDIILEELQKYKYVFHDLNK